MVKDLTTPKQSWFSSHTTPKSSKWSKLLSKSANSSPNEFNYTSRTTSVPRSMINTPTTASTITYTPTPPKVEPFLYKTSSISPPKSRKTLINLKCCFCDELLSSKLSSENIIELNCGHICHEECLFTLLDYKNNIKDPYSIFPNCEVCKKQAIPIDESITDDITSRYLINSSNDNNEYSSNKFISPLSSPTPTRTKYKSLSLSKKNSKDLSIYIPERNYHNHKKFAKSRGSSISAISSIVSSVPKTPEGSPSLNSLRNEFVSNLISNLNDPHFNSNKIRSLGILRLVDKLKISETGENFDEFIVYLFEYDLILINLSYTKIKPYKLPIIPQIKTPNSSTLKISLNDKLLYITHESNKILQKWIAALCDYDFVFNSIDISSTLKLNDGIVNQSINSSVDSIISDQVTIPVLLSPLKLDEEFIKKDNLILVIDYFNSISNENLIILKNISKVLSNKFRSFNFIFSNDFNKVYQIGDITKIESIGQTHELINESIETSIHSITNDFNDYSLIIISNSFISKFDLNFEIKNKLVLLVKSKNNFELLNDTPNVLFIKSWDKIMESLINKLNLNFNNELSDNEFDSDAFDSDFEPEKEPDTSQWSVLLQDIDSVLQTMK